MNLKEIALQKKIKKKKKLANKFFVEQGGADNIFPKFKYQPTVKQFEEMVVASNYGIKDCLSCGGALFSLEYLLNEVKRIYKSNKNNLVDLPEGQGFYLGLGASQSEYYGNLFFLFYVDYLFLDFIVDFNVDDFEIGERDGRCCYIDKETKSIVIWSSYEFLVNSKTIYGDYPYNPVFISSSITNNNYVTKYLVLITTKNNLLDLENEIEKQKKKHNVVSHTRHLNSGKIVPVTEHIRSNPQRINKNRIDSSEVDYIVYCVKDKDGLIRYFGEGKKNRPKHVNSGISHNYKINEHFFLRGLMSVEIIKENLSKQEALALESLFIKSYRENQLWNVKEYEPIFEGD